MNGRNRFKIQCSLGIEWLRLGGPETLGKKKDLPGRLGSLRKPQSTRFGARLREKQKLLFHYGLSEDELRRFTRRAWNLNASNWMENLIGLLERRLDNVVLRLGFARSLAAARLLVAHGRILVNRRPQTIGSLVLSPGDVVWLTGRAEQAKTIEYFLRSARLSLPSWLQYQNPATPDRGVVLSIPHSGHVPFELNRTPAAQYYAKRGV